MADEDEGEDEDDLFDASSQHATNKRKGAQIISDISISMARHCTRGAQQVVRMRENTTTTRSSSNTQQSNRLGVREGVGGQDRA